VSRMVLILIGLQESVREHRNKRRGLEDTQEAGYGGCGHGHSSATKTSAAAAGGYAGECPGTCNVMELTDTITQCRTPIREAITNIHPTPTVEGMIVPVIVAIRVSLTSRKPESMGAYYTILRPIFF